MRSRKESDKEMDQKTFCLCKETKGYSIEKNGTNENARSLQH